MKFSSNYLNDIYRDPKEYAKLVENVVAEVLKLKKTLKFHAIAFRGTSGAAMAYPVSVAIGIPLICVRKASENSHGHALEGSDSIDVKKYIIIDDFISSGSTMNQIVEGIEKSAKAQSKKVKCVGIILYCEEYNGSYSKHKDIPIIRIKKA